MTESRSRAYRGLTRAFLRSYRRRKLGVVAASGGLLLMLLFVYQAPQGLANLSERKVKLGVETTVLHDPALTRLVQALRASSRISAHVTDGEDQDLRELRVGLSDAIVTRSARGLTILSAGPYGRLADVTVGEIIAETELRVRGATMPTVTRTRLGDHAQLLNTNLPNLLTLGLLQVGYGLALTSLLGLRSSGMLRQIRSAGCSARSVVSAVVTANLVVAGAQVVLLAVVGTKLAGASGNPLTLAAIAMLTFVAMSAIGVTVASRGKSLQGSAVAAGISASFLFFLALIPIPNIKNATAQTLMSLTPTGAASEAFRAAIHGPDHRSLATMLVTLLGWCLLFVLLAAKTFRWDRVTA